ncbi:hippurate hydrolase [Coccidioides immitis RMSCC 3703]|uniref:Hippurate hydrolase n=2 Tax=Coccidioides immitis TaxID=5501 RepID=A0A0J8QR87_COCIT|nr:hippurate hydrolase [Coccidioides immitis RMSCC 2394]KMU75031.1 hippurate hydrolase [Coccidioides immitis RMSCC 3703]
MPEFTPTEIGDLIRHHEVDFAPYEELYKHLHAYPELSHQEYKTAATIAARLRCVPGLEVFENIGGTGIAAVLRNGDGKTVLLRSELDGLPIKEQTNLPYAMSAKSEWSGTLVIIYQPAEELGNGAIRMVNDGLYDKVPKPDVLLGQHILPQRAGRFGMRSGTVMAASDCLKITFTGRGGHASMPHRTIDPIVMAASTVVRLQTIVSREINVSQEFAVVTVGSFNAGSAPNIIPEQAEIQLNVRTTDENTRKRVLSSIDRIIKAEGEASGAIQAPQIETTLQFPLTINDPTVTQKVQQTFGSLFSPDFTAEWPRSNASEDFTVLGTSIGRPCCFWFVGCTAAEIWEEAEENGTLSDIPGNHSAFFAPDVLRTMQIGVCSLVAGALSFLSKAQ